MVAFLGVNPYHFVEEIPRGMEKNHLYGYLWYSENMWLSFWGLLQKMVLVCNCKRDQGIQAQLRSIGEAQGGVEPAWISCISWLGIVIDLLWFYAVLWWFMTIRTLTPEKQRKSMSTSGCLADFPPPTSGEAHNASRGGSRASTQRQHTSALDWRFRWREWTATLSEARGKQGIM